MGKLRVYCLKTLNKLSIYPLGNTPSAPNVSWWLTAYNHLVHISHHPCSDMVTGKALGAEGKCVSEPKPVILIRKDQANAKWNTSWPQPAGHWVPLPSQWPPHMQARRMLRISILQCTPSCPSQQHSQRTKETIRVVEYEQQAYVHHRFG